MIRGFIHSIHGCPRLPGEWIAMRNESPGEHCCHCKAGGTGSKERGLYGHLVSEVPCPAPG